MTAYKLKDLVSTTNEKDDDYSNPLDLSDIITICKYFNSLGLQTQSQVENILEIGVEEAIKTGVVKKSSLQHIKRFLQIVSSVHLLGDAASQAYDGIKLITEYEDRYKISYSIAN